MCYGFGCVVLKNGEDFDIYWIKPDRAGDISHAAIKHRMVVNNIINIGEIAYGYDVFRRDIVTMEFPCWIDEPGTFDDFHSFPGWAEDKRVLIYDRCEALMRRVYKVMQDRRSRKSVLLKDFHAKYGKLKSANPSSEEKAEYYNKKGIIEYLYDRELSEIKGYLPG